jgi:hypothetical protein
MTTKMIARVYLKSGQTFSFEAAKVTTVRDRATGEIDSLKWDDLRSGEQPQAFGPFAIAAVTVEHVEVPDA